jgi:hypothetical protein
MVVIALFYENNAIVVFSGFLLSSQILERPL